MLRLLSFFFFFFFNDTATTEIYTLSLHDALPISFKQGAMITAVIGIVMMPRRLYNDAAAYIFTWLIGYGALLGPVAGIMIADYFVLRRGVLVVNDLYKRHGAYEYTHGINGVAVVAFALGVAPSLPGFVAALKGVPATGLFGTMYNWAWFVGLLISGLIYIVGMRMTQRRTNRAVLRSSSDVRTGSRG